MTSDRDKLRSRAKRALNELWRTAHSEDVPQQHRDKLLQWFAELGLGKPKAISDEDRGAPAAVGVVVLPDALPTTLQRSEFGSVVDDAILRALDAEDGDFTD